MPATTPRPAPRAPRAARRRGVVVAAALAALCLTAAIAAPAQAAPKFVHEVLPAEFGPAGPRGLAVNLASVADASTDPTGASTDGYVYVADNGNHRVQVFDGDGEFVFMFGGGVSNGDALGQVCVAGESCQGGVPGGLGGMFSEPQGIVIDQQTGRLWVRDRPFSASNGNPRVQEFEADGTFVRAWGFDVVQPGTDDDTGTGFETCFVAAECQRGASGAGLGQFGVSGNRGGGIDRRASTGEVVVADPANNRINRYAVPADPTQPVAAIGSIGSVSGFGSNSVVVAVDEDGVVYAPLSGSPNSLLRYDLDSATLLDPLPVAALSGSDPSAVTVGLAVDSSSGSLLVARDRFISGQPRYSPVLELGDPGGPVASITHLDTHVPGTNYTWRGVGIDSDSNTMYLPAVSPGGVSSVLVAREGPLPVPSVVFEPYSDVGQSGATVNFALDTTGLLPVGWVVQLSNPESLGEWVTVGSGEAEGSEDPVPISVPVSGLRPGTAYLVRVVTSKPFNNPGSLDVAATPLVTVERAPSVAAVGVDSVTDSSARLTGRIDPHGEQTTYRFEWGTTGFENSVPVPDGSAGAGFGFQFVAEQIEGLEPDADYQARLVATSAVGTTASDPVQFTTQAKAPGAEDRGFELVSPADKCGGQGVGFWPGGLGHLGSSGVASHVGERFAAQSQFGSTLSCDGAFSHSNDWVIAERAGDVAGWLSRSPLTHPNYHPTIGQPVTLRAATEDLAAAHWKAPNTLAFFPELVGGGNPANDRPHWTGHFSAGLISSWAGLADGARWELFGPSALDQVVNISQLGPGQQRADGLLQVGFSADGSTAVGQPQLGATGLPRAHGLAGPLDPTWPAPANPATPGVPAHGDLTSGRSLWLGDLSGGLSDSFATGERRLVNVCTGDGTERTEVPTVDGGLMSAEGCPAGVGGRQRLISARGAAFSTGTYIRPGAISEDGRRVFFLAPDPAATGVPNGTASFCSGTGDSTSCPPQLFVSQQNPDGEVITRWISKAEPDLLGTQAASLTGTVRFEGASRDGSRVFFRTNSPLTVDDPNGQGAPTDGGVTSGTPHAESWDLYMFELAAGPDPTGAGSSLTRISAGPDSDGDCNSPLRASASGDDDTVGALRFLSEDGSRTYFTCQAPLPGVGAPADPSRITAPGGTPSTAGQANLYLHDLNHPDPTDRWRFIARLPRATGSSQAAARHSICATTGIEKRSPFQGDTGSHPNITTNATGSNCVNGTADGAFVTLFTEGRLTADAPQALPVDDPPANAVADIYGYDADRDRLDRLTAPQGGQETPYPCIGDRNGNESELYSCRGDGGMDSQNGVGPLEAAVPMNLGVATRPTNPGDRVAFFQSASRLTADDQDDNYDVYEWRNGKLTLLTDGSPDSQDALYKGNDQTGTNVYFVTRQSLSWQDHDSVADIYTARLGGGIDQPPPPPLCAVLAGGCHGGGAAPMAAPPQRSRALSLALPPTAARPRLTVDRPAARALRRAARSDVLRLAVRVHRPGLVRAIARARVGSGGMRRVGAGQVRARSAGRVVLALRLGPPLRRRLAAGGRVVVAVRVSAPGHRPRTVRFALTRGGAGR